MDIQNNISKYSNFVKQGWVNWHLNIIQLFVIHAIKSIPLFRLNNQFLLQWKPSMVWIIFDFFILKYGTAFKVKMFSIRKEISDLMISHLLIFQSEEFTLIHWEFKEFATDLSVFYGHLFVLNASCFLQHQNVYILTSKLT